MRNHLLLCTVAVTAAATALSPASARAETPQVAATQVDPIVVIGTRSERQASRTPGTISVITDAEIETMLATDIKDLIRYEPGVSVPTSPARFSLALSGAGRDGDLFRGRDRRPR